MLGSAASMLEYLPPFLQLARSGMLSRMNFVNLSCANIGQNQKSLTTLEQLDQIILILLIFCLVAFHVKISARQAGREESMKIQSLVFGGKCIELSKSYGQESQSWKMSAQSDQSEDPQLLDRLPISGIVLNGVLYELQKSERPICGGAGFAWHIPEICLTRDRLLPTPTATGSEHRTRYSQGGRPLMYMLLKAHFGDNLKLRPQFVEWMMGFPENWTNPE